MPPKNADVVQKLQPIGQPTDGMMVAAVVPLLLRQRDAQDARAEAGDDLGMADRRALVLAQEAAHPGDAVAAHDVVGVDHRLDAGNGGHVPADHDRGLRRELAHHAAHLAHLADVDDDRGDADDVVVGWRCSSAAKASRVGKSSTVVGAEMFSWIIRMPQERWNMRSENGPCSRVTWLWYSSIGLMVRLPNSSSWA